MDLHYEREIGVGTMVLVGIALFVAGTMWLQGESFHAGKRTAQIDFTEIGNLQIDNDVAVSGYNVGKVTAVDFKGPGRILVSVNLPPDLSLKRDATAEICGTRRDSPRAR